MKALGYRTVILASVSALALPVAAMAQDATDAPEAGPAAADVVVTGSRVIRNGDQSPTPLTVADTAEILAAQPNSVVDALLTLPTFSGSRTSTSNPGGNGANPGGAAGNGAANILNLRNLGGIRTLILFDGKRVMPNTVEGFVNVDVIPQSVLKRVAGRQPDGAAAGTSACGRSSPGGTIQRA